MANKRFKRQEYARYKKLGIKWRRPRGKTSKMRRYEAGKPDMPAIGSVSYTHLRAHET